MSEDKTAQRVWKATLVFETYADLRSFLHKHGVRIQDFEITDSEGKHLGFDEVVLLMGKPSDDGQQTLYDEA